jgi:tRNA A-37 threonylcarbamoyl transferase component Bud32
VSGPFQTLSRGGRTGYAVAELPRDLLIRLVECPELPLRMGPAETVKAGNSALVVRAQLPIGDRLVPVAYKRVRRKTWAKQLTQFLGPNRTLRTFRAGHRLLEKGIATARPLAVIVPSRFDPTAPTWVATEWLEGAEDLTAFARRCRRLSPGQRNQAATAVAVALGGLLGRMHAVGVSHRDLKPQNLMVRYELGSEAAEAFVIDLDGVRFLGGAGLRWKNLSRLAIGENAWHGFGLTVRRRFLLAYCEAAGLRMPWKAAWLALAAATKTRQRRRMAA